MKSLSIHEDIERECRTSSNKYMNYVNLIVKLLNRTLKENLVSVVLFGSVARGVAFV